MTEDESRKALFQLHYDYMSHPPKERLKLYDEYKRQREEIRKQLAEAIIKKVENKKVYSKYLFC